MFIVENINNCKLHNIYFLEQVKNNIIKNGHFIKLIYSSSNFIMNGLFLYLELDGIYKYENNKVYFDINKNISTLNIIKTIELYILNTINNTNSDNNIKINKSPQYKIFEQLKNGYIFYFFNKNDFINYSAKKTQFILKISGIWITENNYGLSYKFENLSVSRII